MSRPASEPTPPETAAATADAPSAANPPTSTGRGARAAAGTGLLVLVLSMCAHVGNYLYYVVALRILGPVEFAQVSAITAIGNMAFMPFNGVQAAVAKEVARARATGRADEAGATVLWMVRRMLALQIGLFAVLVALWPVVGPVLRISGIWAWVGGVLWLALGVGMQSWLGVAQGEERFLQVGGVMAGPAGVLRVVFLVPLALLAGVAGAMWALVLATVVGLLWLTPVVRRQIAASGGRRRAVPHLALAVVGLLAFGSLTNIDLVVAKALMSEVDAGHYASASLLAKVAFYAPSALSLMLLPSVTARLAAARDVTRPILATLAAAVGTGLLVLLAVALAPSSLLALVFGPAFAEAHSIAIPLTAVMTGAAVLNVHLMVALAAGEKRFVQLAVVGAAVHACLLMLFAETPSGAVLASALAIGGLVFCYEVLSRYGAIRLLLRRARS